MVLIGLSGHLYGKPKKASVRRQGIDVEVFKSVFKSSVKCSNHWLTNDWLTNDLNTSAHK